MSNKKDKKHPSTSFNMLMNELQEILRNYEGKIQDFSQENFFRRIIHRYLSPYFHTQSHINFSFNTLLQRVQEQMQSVRKNLRLLQKSHAELKNDVNFLAEVQLKSHIADTNAIKEKQAYLMNKVIRDDYDFRGPSGQSTKVFYSQFGEDEWIVKNFPDLPRNGTFIEVGVADGITFSNTYYFEKLGWQGVCFEPHPYQFAQAKLYRKNVEQAAITNKDGDVTLYLSQSYPDWSSTIRSDDTTAEVTVPGITLRTVISESKIKTLDLLSIDVEGAELAVLEGFPFEVVKPHIIVIEFINKLNEENMEVATFMREQPYRLVHQTFANYIYVSK